MAACAKCGAALSEGATFCGSCGAPVGSAGTGAGSAPAAAGGLTSNVAGALAYFTVIPAIVFLVLEPFNKDKFVRFHAFQCLFVAGASIVLSIGLAIVTTILAFIPVVGWIIGLFVWPIYGLVMLALVVFLMYKAYNNEKYMVPVIGPMAAKQAG